MAMDERRPPNTFESIGLAATTAVLVVNATHPIDFVKTRRQVDVSFSIVQGIKSEGVLSLYKGLTAAWLREFAYTSIKLGAYGPVRDALGGQNSFGLKFLAGATTGGLGSILGNPFDLLKTRLMTAVTANANTAGPRGLVGISKDLYHHQGIGGFYRGLQANIMRAIALNAVKMSTYDAVKGKVHTMTGWSRRDPRCQLTSSFVAGFAMAICITPFDFLRTKLMNQPSDKKIYNGFAHAVYTIMKTEGPLTFYRGFVMIWGRFVPQATLQLITYETLLNFCGFKPI